jgi:hypothetical protein
VTSRDPDRNAWADHPGPLEAPQGLSPVWTRDPLDGAPLGPFLDRLAVRRGREAVRSQLLAWLSEPVLSGGAHGGED